MVFRSLVTVTLAVGVMIAGSASAQVLYCPDPAELKTSDDANRAEAKKLLERLLTALDLHGRDGVDQDVFLKAHEDTPGALLAKLSNVADRCSLTAMNNAASFHEHLPDLRRTFLEAVLKGGPSSAGSGEGEDVDVEDLEKTINLSLRDLWRKLWFRPQIPEDDQQDHRWAVIVASPDSVSKGWDKLDEHQTAWGDTYFELHQPYYDDSGFHAIVVGKKLPRSEAERLLAYVKELGMADDSFLWPVPVEDAAKVASEEPPNDVLNNIVEAAKVRRDRERLDLSILKN